VFVTKEIKNGFKELRSQPDGEKPQNAYVLFKSLPLANRVTLCTFCIHLSTIILANKKTSLSTITGTLGNTYSLIFSTLIELFSQGKMKAVEEMALAKL